MEQMTLIGFQNGRVFGNILDGATVQPRVTFLREAIRAATLIVALQYSEINQTQLFQDAYHCYRRNNLVIPQKAFSRRILSQHPSYYSSMVTRNRKPSRKVLQSLLTVTKTILATFIGNPHFGKPYAVNLNAAFDQLEDLVQQVSVQLDIGCVVESLGE